MKLRNLFILAAAALIATPAMAHKGHDHQAQPHREAPREVNIQLAQADGQPPKDATSGQGEYVFRVLYTSSHLPAKAQEVLVNAHGGFAIDRREGQGEAYFALPGAGIIKISSDFKTTSLLDTDPVVADNNQHNTTLWTSGGNTYLVFPGNGSAAVYTTDLSGKLLNTLGAPTKDSFDERRVSRYFEEGGGFVPTDVEFVNGRYYVATGYSKLDYVLTAAVETDGGVNAEWGGLVFGGKGNDPGEFGTGHGISLMETTIAAGNLAVADRPNSEIEYFNAAGDYLGRVGLPKGSFPCDTDAEAGIMTVGCLHGPDRDKGAPIYLVVDGEVVSTIMCKEELGLANFRHIHNAAMRVVDGKVYILAQAWNPGDFAILEQVK